MLLRRKRLLVVYMGCMAAACLLAYNLLPPVNHDNVPRLRMLQENSANDSTADLTLLLDQIDEHLQQQRQIASSVGTAMDAQEFLPHETGERDNKLEDCSLWIPISASPGSVDSFLTSCSVESGLVHGIGANEESDTEDAAKDDYNNPADDNKSTSDEMSGSKVCLVLDRRERGSDQVILGLNWFKRLSAKYPGKLQVVLPDYPTIFAGTILEEILDTTADMASGVIWALLWKYGGMLVAPDVILCPGMTLRRQSSRHVQSFLIVDQDRNQSLIHLIGLADHRPHDEIASRVLQRLINKAVATKDNQIAMEQKNLLRVSVDGINVKTVLDDIDEAAWTQEVERECGEKIVKISSSELCQNIDFLSSEVCPSFGSLDRLSSVIKDDLKDANNPNKWIGLNLRDSRQLFNKSGKLNLRLKPNETYKIAQFFQTTCPLTTKNIFKIT